MLLALFPSLKKVRKIVIIGPINFIKFEYFIALSGLMLIKK